MNIDNEDIAQHLHQEEEWLSQLQDNINKSREFRDDMCTILDTITGRLETLESTVLPLYEYTGILQRRQKNMSSALVALDSVLNNYSTVNEVETTIRDSRPCDNLDGYIIAMNRLREAMMYFSVATNSKSGHQLETVKSVFEFGCGSLESEFTQVLSRITPAISPSQLNYCIHDFEPMYDRLNELNVMPTDALEKLIKISHWLNDNSGSDLIRSDLSQQYADSRANRMCKVIHEYQSWRKSNSASNNSVQQTLMTRAARDSRNRIRKFSSRPYAADSTNKRQTMAVESVTESLFEDDAATFLLLLASFLLLLQRETECASEIFSTEQMTKVKPILITIPFNLCMQYGVNLHKSVSVSEADGDHSAVFCLFGVIDSLQNSTCVYQDLLKNIHHSTQNETPWIVYQTYLKSLHITCNDALETFIKRIKEDSDKVVPKDGTVHQLTSNCLRFLQQLTDYKQILVSVLPPGPEDDAKNSVPKYFARVLSYLNYNLTGKASMYSNVILKSIFMLNNTNHILKSLNKTGAMSVVQKQNPDVANYYTTTVKEHRDIYMQGFNRLISAVSEDQNNRFRNSPALANRNLKDKDRQSLKDSFALFNKELESISTTQKSFSVPDQVLASELIREAKDKIVPKYTLFYNKWSGVTFSKNMDKYVKYTPQNVSDILSHLFDLK